MNYSKPRKCTVKKYTLYLKSLIIKIDKYGELFSSTKFREENPIPQNFITICQQLNYVSSFRNGKDKIFHAILASDQINESHGLAIAETSLRYNVNHSETYKNRGNNIVTSRDEKINSKSNLSDLSTEELLSELKRRGYSGELIKSVFI